MLCQTQLHHGTQALLLAWMDPQLHIFQDQFKENGTLKTEGYNFTQIKLSITFYSLPWGPLEIIPAVPQKPIPTSNGEIPSAQFSGNRSIFFWFLHDFFFIFDFLQF